MTRKRYFFDATLAISVEVDAESAAEALAEAERVVDSSLFLVEPATVEGWNSNPLAGASTRLVRVGSERDGLVEETDVEDIPDGE